MDWGNLILFWIIAAVVLLIVNFTLFRLGFIRKLLHIACSIILIICGFEVNKLLEKEAFMIGGSSLSWDNDNIDTLIMVSVIMLIMLVLISFGDSLLDFEESTDYDVDVTGFLGVYFFSVSEETVHFPSFFMYYGIATVVGLVTYFVFIFLLHWFWIFGVLGCIALAYELVVKPIILKLFS